MAPANGASPAPVHALWQPRRDARLLRAGGAGLRYDRRITEQIFGEDGMSATAFLEARDFLLAHREDYEPAYRDFRWPELDRFNWALDYFDPMAQGNDRTGLWIVDEGGGETRLSFAEIAQRSSRAANYLRGLGVRRGDRLLMMLGNVAPLVGMHAGGDEARRRPDSGDDVAEPRRSRRPLSRAAGSAMSSPASTTSANSPNCPAIIRASRSAARCPAGTAGRRATTRRRSSRRTARRRRATRCCSTSPRAPRPSQSWCCTAIRAIRSVI